MTYQCSMKSVPTCLVSARDMRQRYIGQMRFHALSVRAFDPQFAPAGTRGSVVKRHVGLFNIRVGSKRDSKSFVWITFTRDMQCRWTTPERQATTTGSFANTIPCRLLTVLPNGRKSPNTAVEGGLSLALHRLRSTYETRIRERTKATEQFNYC